MAPSTKVTFEIEWYDTSNNRWEPCMNDNDADGALSFPTVNEAREDINRSLEGFRDGHVHDRYRVVRVVVSREVV